MEKEKGIEELLSSYLEGSLNEEDQKKVKLWNDASEENLKVFCSFEEVWHFARPKSMTLTCPWGVSMIFAGLRSRCMI